MATHTDIISCLWPNYCLNYYLGLATFKFSIKTVYLKKYYIFSKIIYGLLGVITFIINIVNISANDALHSISKVIMTSYWILGDIYILSCTLLAKNKVIFKLHQEIFDVNSNLQNLGFQINYRNVKILSLIYMVSYIIGLFWYFTILILSHEITLFFVIQYVILYMACLCYISQSCLFYISMLFVTGIVKELAVRVQNTTDYKFVKVYVKLLISANIIVKTSNSMFEFQFLCSCATMFALLIFKLYNIAYYCIILNSNFETALYGGVLFIITGFF